MATPTVDAGTARRFLLQGQGLLADPSRRATPAAVMRQIERMGFVQVDSINVVERAHHHILMSRFDDYRPRVLTHLLEKNRKLFEHWTHDASVIPRDWLPYWLHRFDRYERTMRARPNWNKRLGGRIDAMLDDVRARLDAEGPLRSADFEHPSRGGSSGFWNWKPQKAALEFLWRSGEVAVAGRQSFQKLYDLSERVFPEWPALDRCDEAEHVDWACRAAFDRLELATPGEVAAYLDAVSNADARRWCSAAADRGELEEIVVEAVDGSKPRKAYARCGWRRRASRLPDAPDRTRLVSPFDPVIRDRQRTERLFGFDYRIEVFVPAAKRQYGYYVLPILEGEQFIGRLDPKHDRERETLCVNGLWWEPGTRPTAKRRRNVVRALERFAEQIGAERLDLSGAVRRAL